MFVCYAHEDSDIVYPELGWIRNQGINFWVDNFPVTMRIADEDEWLATLVGRKGSFHWANL